MQNEYLEVLELAPGASKTEIKRAFRRLSKQYHPDINRNENAQERFIAIHEAYRFLTEVGPNPNNERVSYDYDPKKAAYDDRRRRAYQYAWKKAQEAKRQQELQLKLIFRYFNYYAGFFFVFNLFIALDYFLPKREFVEKVISSNHPDSRVDGSYYHANRFLRYDEIRFENFHMKFDRQEARKVYNVQEALVVTTFLFKTPLYAAFTVNDQKIQIRQVYGLYQVFGFLIPASFIVLALYRFLENPDHRISLGLLLILFSFIQFFLFFKYSL